jgi:hypothetical protein
MKTTPMWRHQLENLKRITLVLTAWRSPRSLWSSSLRLQLTARDLCRQSRQMRAQLDAGFRDSLEDM